MCHTNISVSCSTIKVSQSSWEDKWNLERQVQVDPPPALAGCVSYLFLLAQFLNWNVGCILQQVRVLVCYMLANWISVYQEGSQG